MPNRLRIGMLFSLLLGLGWSCPTPEMSVSRLVPNLSRYRVDSSAPLEVWFTQSVDASTVNADSFYVTAGESADAPRVPGSVSVEVTRIIFRPSTPFQFGIRYRVHVAGSIRSRHGEHFNGQFATVTYGKTDVPAPPDVFVVNVPGELNEEQLGEDYGVLAYNPAAPELTDPAYPERVPGISATEAWKLSPGRPDVLVAILDNGVRGYRHPDLVQALFLNRGELPPPRDAQGRTACGTSVCPDPYDFDGNGRLNVADYRAAGHAIAVSGTLEPVLDINGDGQIDPGDLIEQFDDGVDGYSADSEAANDANSLADDISGYDFLRDVPQSFGLHDFPEGTHGEGRAREAVSAADGSGGVGVCPNCSVLVVRFTYSLVGDGESFRRALQYALEMKANVVVSILGAINGTAAQAAALREADAAGVPVITGQGDESSFHHSYPSILNHTLTIKSNGAFFVESYCTGFGANIDIASSGLCSSSGAARVGGGIGLLLSRARDLGFCADSDPSNPLCLHHDLGANEIKQLLTGTAEKPNNLSACKGILTDAPCKRDPDMHQGYGRLNLFAAMARLEDAPLPPEVQILEPGWFGRFDPGHVTSLAIGGSVKARSALDSVSCTWAPGPEPDSARFTEFPCAVDEAGRLSANLDLGPVVAALGGVSRPPTGPEDGAFTVRVQAVAGGALGQDRRVYALRRDVDAVAGFPVSLVAREGDGVEVVDEQAPLAPSIEASPALADVDGNGKDELILGTSNGQLHVLEYAGGQVRERSGWPIRLQGGKLPIDAMVAAPAVGDVDRDGSLDIVVATLGGAVHAFRGRDGHPLGGATGIIGLPDEPDNTTANSFGAGFSFFGSPVLTDLDGDTFLDVVVGGADQKVYAFSGASIAGGTPQRLPGWPVFLSDAAGGCSATAVSIAASVGAVDLDGDDKDEIVAGTSEICDEASGRLYAVHSDGNLNPQGPLLAGFPMRIQSNAPGVGLDLPPLTTGILVAPASVRIGSEVALGTGTFLGPPTMAFVDRETGATRTEDLVGTLLFGAGGSGALSRRFFSGGLPTYGIGAVTLGRTDGHGLVEFLHRTLGWELGGDDLARAKQEDYQFLSNPGFADVDDDGTDELISAGGGHLVHAFKRSGEAHGWPKLTYGWHIASPAFGDLDGDGLLELVAPVREGRIFAWHTDAQLCDGHGWPTFRHDNRRTGFLDTPISDPRCP